MALPKLELCNGVEQQFNANHLGHFVLVHDLLDRVKQADQGRVVMLSSLGHKLEPAAGIDFDNLDGSKWYKDWSFYGQSKLANLLTAVALSKRLEGTNATANAVHPGMIKTNLSRNMTGIQAMILNNPVSGWLLRRVLDSKSIPEGAATQCYAATAVDLADISGRYFSDSNETRPSKLGQDQTLANRLWDYSVNKLQPYP